MQFIEDKKAQALGSINDVLFKRPGKYKFQHDIICQQNVWRIGNDLLFLLIFFLTGIPCKSNRLESFWVSIAEEFFQLSILAVTKSIHRIDNDCLNAFSRSNTKDMIYNGNNISQTFA